MMNDRYSIVPATTAILYAMAAAVGIGLFVLAGRAAQQYGPLLVFRAGLAVRTAGFGVLAAVTMLSPPGASAAAMLGFTLVVLAWPVLSVSRHRACGEPDPDRRRGRNGSPSREQRNGHAVEHGSGRVFV
jgi:hypothetical protein